MTVDQKNNTKNKKREPEDGVVMSPPTKLMASRAGPALLEV